MTTPVTITDNNDGTATVTLVSEATLPPDVELNPDGSITLNVRLRFLNPFDINTTGVGTITVLPGESLAAFLPLLGRGDAGPAPQFSATGIRHEVPYSDPLPNPNMLVNLIDPGNPGAGVGPTYQLEVWEHAGQAGPPGTPVNLRALGDVISPTTPAPGTQLVWRAPTDGSSAGFYIEPVRVTDFVPCTSFNPANGNQPNQTLGSLTLPARNYARQASCVAQCQVNPAADATNGITHINLIARLGDVNNGPIIAFGRGLETTSPFICNMFPTPAAVGGSAIIAAGASAQIFLIAQQTNATLSNWGTDMTDATFSAQALALV